MKLLIIGGTQFLGRHFALRAREFGHDVTLFNRGIRNPQWLGDFEHIRGDRRGDLSELAGRSWDAVFDSSAYLPSDVERLARRLSNAVEHYTLVSTISVYINLDGNTTEKSSVATASKEQIEAAEQLTPPPRSIAGGGYGDAYGALKAGCERIAMELFHKTLVVRPGFIVGPDDYSPRFRYWLDRTRRGGMVLAPGSPDRPIRIIDVRDIAEWVVEMASSRTTGIFNATGSEGVTMGKMLDACAKNTRSKYIWIEDNALLSAGVRPFSDLPYWVPTEMNDIFLVANVAAESAGLKFRSLEETVYDTRSSTLSPNSEVEGHGLTREFERRLIEKELLNRSGSE